MKRREAFKNISLFLSGTLVLPTSSIFLNSCSSPDKELNWIPKYLNNDEAFLLNELSNTIIPNSEFPGALVVGVPSEIESYIFNVLEEKNISKFRDGLKKLNHFLNNNSSKSSKPFFESNLLEKTKMLIEEALESSSMKPSRINQTLLVGGSTRIPAVVQSLTKLMGKPPVKGVNVDEAVVCGAAVYAGLKTEDKSLNKKQQELSLIHI